jgi:N-acetylneuraminic acid mutarotase
VKTIIFISFFLLNTYCFSQIDSVGRWFSRAPMPTARQEIAHAILNGKIYVPGGLATGGVGTTTVEAFDPLTNSWSTVAPLPEPLHHLGLAVANGRLYVLGGYSGNSFVPNHKVWSLYPDSNIWREKTPMLISRGAHIAVTFQNKIYVIGGVIMGFTVSGRTDVYDPLLDSWEILANMPTPREHLSGALIDSLIYVAGGRSGAGNFNKLEAYSPLSNIWYSKPNMPTARGGLTAASLNGKLYVFGGETPGVFSQNEEYNPVTNSWKTMTPMKTPRHGIGAVAAGDSIFIIGGGVVEGYSVTNVNDVFTLAPLVLKLNVFVEGFFDRSSNTMIRDTVKVYLQKTFFPFEIVDSSKAYLSNNGFANFKFNKAVSDSGYYLVIKHRNSIETWSSSGYSFTPSLINYDFTTSATKAYGNNLILKGTKYCIYSGDVNQDGFIDGSDLALTDNDAFTFASGYLSTDVTGDNIIDASDLSVIDNNAFNNVIKITP